MRISPEMIKAINERISYEASSANAYIAIGLWGERTGYDGSAAFFFEQASEENQHMRRFIHYLNGAGAEAIAPAIDKPQNTLNHFKLHSNSVCKANKQYPNQFMSWLMWPEKKKTIPLTRFSSGL